MHLCPQKQAGKGSEGVQWPVTAKITTDRTLDAINQYVVSSGLFWIIAQTYFFWT